MFILIGMNKIQLPKKVIRDLDNYIKFINLALYYGYGKYRNLSAETLYQMKIFYYLMRSNLTKNSLFKIYKYTTNLYKTSDFFIPCSCDDFLIKVLKINK